VSGLEKENQTAVGAHQFLMTDDFTPPRAGWIDAERMKRITNWCELSRHGKAVCSGNRVCDQAARSVIKMDASKVQSEKAGDLQ